MIFMGLEFVLMGGGGYMLYKDFRYNNLRGTRRLIEKISAGKIRLLEESKYQGRIESAQNDVNESAKQVARLREAVASVEGNMKMHLQVVNEQRDLIDQFEILLQKAIKNGDEVAQITAASAKVQAQQKGEMNQKLADAEAGVLPGLIQQLDDAELELSLRQDQADAIRATSEYAETMTQLYAIQSNISSETGFTAKARLGQAMLESQREVYKAESLLGMAQRANSHGSTRRLLLSARVTSEIESARQRSALPATESESDGSLIAEVVASES